MVIGITMLKVAPGHEKACYEALKETVGIREIYHLFGEFDFFLILEALDNRELSVLLEDIRGQKHILDSWSLLVSEKERLPGAGPAFLHIRELAVS